MEIGETWPLNPYLPNMGERMQMRKTSTKTNTKVRMEVQIFGQTQSNGTMFERIWKNHSWLWNYAQDGISGEALRKEGNVLANPEECSDVDWKTMGK